MNLSAISGQITVTTTSFTCRWQQTGWTSVWLESHYTFVAHSCIFFLEKEKKRIFLMNQIMTVFEWKLIKFKWDGVDVLKIHHMCNELISWHISSSKMSLLQILPVSQQVFWNWSTSSFTEQIHYKYKGECTRSTVMHSGWIQWEEKMWSRDR